jgi:dihydrofolate reductase
MGDLIYTMLASLDGYVADEHGDFSWAQPDEEVHRFVNELERPVGTHLLGRRMYGVMSVWDDPEAFAAGPPWVRDYGGIWRAADKVVYSTTLAAPDVRTARTRIENRFDPDAVRELKKAAEHDFSIGGPHLAGAALRAGLVDELRVFVVHAVVGGGTHWLPQGVRLQVDLLEERRFACGVVYLRYGVRGPLDLPPRSG